MTITNDGRNVIAESFCGQSGAIATWIALGTGTTAAAVTDIALAAEAIRIPVTTALADTANNRIVFKAVLPPGSVPTITEIGIIKDGVSTSRLVARTVLATPNVTDADLPTEIEYSLEVSA